MAVVVLTTRGPSAVEAVCYPLFIGTDDNRALAGCVGIARYDRGGLKPQSPLLRYAALKGTLFHEKAALTFFPRANSQAFTARCPRHLARGGALHTKTTHLLFEHGDLALVGGASALAAGGADYGYHR